MYLLLSLVHLTRETNWTYITKYEILNEHRGGIVVYVYVWKTDSEIYCETMFTKHHQTQFFFLVFNFKNDYTLSEVFQLDEEYSFQRHGTIIQSPIIHFE